MAETLGSLCDKLSIVKLKQWHSEEQARLASLAIQENQLQEEIDQFVGAAIAGEIPLARLTFASNKVHKPQKITTTPITGSLGDTVSRLAATNNELWHEQEKVYDIEQVPTEERDLLIKRLALLNLERNNCIDHIDRLFQAAVTSRLSSHLCKSTLE